MLRVSTLLGVALFALVACDEAVTTQPTQQAPQAQQSSNAQLSASQATRAFVEVTRRVEPVAERECRARTSGMDCDFKIVVDLSLIHI